MERFKGIPMEVFHLQKNSMATPVAERLRVLFLLLNHSIVSPLSGVSSSPELATCETSQVLLAGMPGGFSLGSPIFAHLLIGSSHMS